jgi:CheY-like chemotaxis protein
MVARRLNRDVLIVDDDPDCLDALRFLLEDRGYRVHAAKNGQEALEHFQGGGRADVIVLDLLMPVMDGLEFLERRRANPALARTPVIVLTATDARLASREDIVMRKPVDFGQLMAMIESYSAPPSGGASEVSHP